MKRLGAFLEHGARLATVCSLIVIAFYTLFTYKLFTEMSRQTELVRKANRAYVLLWPGRITFGMVDVPELWLFELQIMNVGQQPAYKVRTRWSVSTDSLMTDSDENPLDYGVVFPGQPLSVIASTTKALIQHDQSQGKRTFLHVRADYKDIEGKTHYYRGVFEFYYEEGVTLKFNPVSADADTS